VGLSGTTVLLTGGSSGIGAATARTLAAAGARILLSGRNTARLRAVAAETGGIALAADLAAPGGPAALAAAAMRAAAVWDSDGYEAAADAVPFRAPAPEPMNWPAPRAGPPGPGPAADGIVIATMPRPAQIGRAQAGRAQTGPAQTGPAQIGPAHAGPVGLPAITQPAAAGVDILINNAGIGWAGPLTEMSAATVAHVVAVNLTAPIELTRLLTPALGAGGRGRVVFISSIAGATGVTQEAVYAATKAGLCCFAESLRYELAGTDVGVSVVVPGVVSTPFFARRGVPYGRRRPSPIAAQRVARTVLTAIEREQAMTFVPRWLGFPAWLHGAAPGTFRALAARFG
jgi:short-subunit dehydrogenase